MFALKNRNAVCLRKNKVRDATNPIALRDEIESMLHKLFEPPAAKEGQAENLFETLGL